MVTPLQKWLSCWELQGVVSKVQGVGGIQLAKQSKSIVQTEGPDGQLAAVHPFVLNLKFTLWGRNAMSQWGVRLKIPKTPQHF